MLKKIDHVNVVVGDLARAREFFCKLGFVVTHAGDLEGGWISAIVGLTDVRASYVQLALGETDCRLELIAFESPPSPPASLENRPHHIGIRHMAFEVDDIEALVTRLMDDGTRFFSDVQTYPATGKKLVYFYGPDGIILEFAQYSEAS
jgi:catechol 2,3-dioxygenase-like lactoylglutathione lyase family enzyme